MVVENSLTAALGRSMNFPTTKDSIILGAGLLLLMPFALLFNGKALLALPKKYPALLILLLGFFLYALSNRVRFAGVEIFCLPLASLVEFFDRNF